MIYYASPVEPGIGAVIAAADQSRGAAGERKRGQTIELKAPMSADVPMNPPLSAAIAEDETRTLSLLHLTLLGLALGIVTGIGAVLFRDLINVLHNLFFAGRFSFAYDANVFTAPSRWGPFIILAPVIGGVIVTFLVSNFAPEAKGHGVPEVMDAIYYKEGVIRPIVALVKSLASAFAIGSGSSVGREGPIIQIGSAIGSTLGQSSRCPPASGSPSSPPARERASPRPSTRRSAA